MFVTVCLPLRFVELKFYLMLSSLLFIRLNEITVKGDEVFNDTAGPRTRSTRASRPAQFSMVPLLAKLTKLLLMEVNRRCQEATMNFKLLCRLLLYVCAYVYNNMYVALIL